MDEATKDELTARFRAYLEDASVIGGQDPDAEAESIPDLFTLLGEVAALKNEVKLESRNLKSALEEFRGLYATLREANTRLADEQARCREKEQLLEQQARKELLLELLELRERMQAGREQAARFRPGWLPGKAAVRFIASMGEGMDMNLRRLDETLARRGVRPLPAVGETFDPHTMHAAELANDPARDRGLVVGELRKGFLLGDSLLRSAEVIVNRPDDD